MIYVEKIWTKYAGLADNRNVFSCQDVAIMILLSVCSKRLPANITKPFSFGEYRILYSNIIRMNSCYVNWDVKISGQDTILKSGLMGSGITLKSLQVPNPRLHIVPARSFSTCISVLLKIQRQDPLKPDLLLYPDHNIFITSTQFFVQQI